MRTRMFPLTLLAVFAPAALAQVDCARSVAQSLTDGRLGELARRFDDTSPAFTARLQALREQLGDLTRLEPASTARPGLSVRLSIARSGLPLSYDYRGLWLNAESAALGPVQLHLAVKPGTECELLALHVNRYARP